MSLAATTEKVKTISTHADSLGNSIKFDFGEGNGSIYLDGKGDANVVSNDDKAADCTVSIALEDFNDMLAGTLDPMGAFMQGKIKLDGDMSVAMKLQSLFGQ